MQSIKMLHAQQLINYEAGDREFPAMGLLEAMQSWLTNDGPTQEVITNNPAESGEDISLKKLKSSSGFSTLSKYPGEGIGVAHLEGQGLTLFMKIRYEPELVATESQLYEIPPELKQVHQDVFATATQITGGVIYKLYSVEDVRENNLRQFPHYHSMDGNDCMGRMNLLGSPIFNEPPHSVREFFYNYQNGLRFIYLSSMGTNPNIHKHMPISPNVLYDMGYDDTLHKKEGVWLGKKDRRFERRNRSEEHQLHNFINIS